MRILNIQIEQNGAMVPVGLIRGNDPGDACFEYFPEYLSRSDSAALSISLPLQREPFPPSQTASFFEGLLPEGFTRRSVAQRHIQICRARHQIAPFTDRGFRKSRVIL